MCNRVCNIIYSITSKYLTPDESKQTFAVPMGKHNNKRLKRMRTAWLAEISVRLHSDTQYKQQDWH